MHVRTTARDLARWLEREGGHWTVDGEPSLARSLPLPAPADALVAALDRREQAVAILLPDASPLRCDEAVALDDIRAAAHVVDGHRVFQLAWIGADGELADSWLLAEQRSVRSSDPGFAAVQVIAAFRAQKPQTPRG